MYFIGVSSHSYIGHCSNFQKNHEIPTNVTDKIMKFTTKSVHIVASVAHLKYLYIYKISICKIYMFKVCTYFVQCVKNVRGLGFRVNSIVGFCFM